MSSISAEIGSSSGRLGGAQDERPLTDQEYQLLQRLLSDPFSFPIAFKTWLVSYLEGSDMSMPMSAVQGLTALLGVSSFGSGTIGILPPGLILPYGGTTAPTGTLLCDGTSYLRVDYSRLYPIIGLGYTAVDDGVHFNVPDLRGRGLVFLGPHPLVNALGKTEGQADPAKRSPRHATSKNLSATGSFSAATYAGLDTYGSATLKSDANAQNQGGPHPFGTVTVTINGTVGSIDPNDGHTDMAAFNVANAIIVI